MIDEIPDDIDLEADQKATIGNLDDVRKIALRLREVQEKIAVVEADLKKLQEEEHQLESKDLPDVMISCNVKDFTFDDGTGITIKDIMKANIPTSAAIEKALGDEKDELIERRKDAFKWLRENDGEPLIKNILAFEFGKGQDNIVGDFIAQAEELEIPHLREEKVHAATLEKFLKGKTEKGVNVPVDTFKIYTGKKAVVKKKKS